MRRKRGYEASKKMSVFLLLQLRSRKVYAKDSLAKNSRALKKFILHLKKQHKIKSKNKICIKSC
ncbi:hypothetical protein [Campylobacter troglodytis]|uniref:hypothetical protein n=1 Tax=Campylobacter troglodytis TaxID=654363 RepID=UPI0011597F6E|nr:hypothetical protein [Campylobacter troglodytis]TQR56917.1 hypothetical protein DMC01_08815 [Campylobacter troglodytis]